MFDEFLRKCPPKDEIKVSKKRVKKNIAAVMSLIEKEESYMTKRKFRFNPMMVTAAIIMTSVVSLLTVNAATKRTANADIKGTAVNFIMGGEEIEGEYLDYVDEKGFRHISFGATMPIYEENFAIIFDVDAPREEAVRVITDETGSEFMDNIRRYRKASKEAFDAVSVLEKTENGATIRSADPDLLPKPEDFGIVLKDSELCTYRFGFVSRNEGFSCSDGTLGGEFLTTGTAAGHPSGSDDDNPNECHYDWDNEIKTFRVSYRFYVGKE